MNKTLQRFATIRTITFLLVISVGLLIFSGKSYYDNVYLGTNNVFWASIDAALNTDAVTRVTENESGDQVVSNTVRQRFVGELQLKSDVEVRNGDDYVLVESRSFTDADYLRYNDIKLGDAEEQAKVDDAVGVWAVNSVEPSQIRDSLVRAFVLFGKLDSSNRSDIVSALRDSSAYSINEDEVIINTVDGRDLYTYDVSIDLAEFYPVLADYLRALGQAEYADFVDVQADSAIGVETVGIVIDAKSRHITEIIESSSTQKVSDYGVYEDLERVDTDIDFEDLQQLLN